MMRGNGLSGWPGGRWVWVPVLGIMRNVCIRSSFFLVLVLFRIFPLSIRDA